MPHVKLSGDRGGLTVHQETYFVQISGTVDGRDVRFSLDADDAYRVAWLMLPRQACASAYNPTGPPHSVPIPQLVADKLTTAYSDEGVQLVVTDAAGRHTAVFIPRSLFASSDLMQPR